MHEITSAVSAAKALASTPTSEGSTGHPTQTISASAKMSRSQGIDFLRGLAILAVVALHLYVHVPVKSPIVERWPRSLHAVVFASGYYGVIVFLVVSGYLITTISLRRWGSLAAVKPTAFYQLRFARIAPPLLLLIAILIPLHLAAVSGFVIPREKASLWSVVLAALTFRINTLEAAGYFLPACWGVLWSLSIEETFYLGFPLAARLLRKEFAFIALLGAFIVLGPMARTFWPDFDDHTYLECMDGIAFGCLAAILSSRWRLSKRTAWLLFGVGILAILFIEVCRGWVYALGLTQNGLYVSILAIGTAAVLLVLPRIPPWSLGNSLSRPLRFAGRYSYEIYLSHGFIMIGLGALFRRCALSSDWVLPTYVTGIFLCIVLGWAVAVLFSEPANRVLRRRF